MERTGPHAHADEHTIISFLLVMYSVVFAAMIASVVLS
jgi:hypothetical protein